MIEQAQTNFCGECRSCWALNKCAGCEQPFVVDRELERKRLCLGSPQLPEVLANISGLDFPDLTVPTRRPIKTRFIPQLVGPCLRYESVFDYPIVAVAVNRVFGVRGGVKEELLGAGTVQKWLNVSPRTRVLLIGCAQDEFLENIWQQLDVNATFKRLAGLGFSAMTAFNFSIYHNEPRMEHLVNLKRSALTALEAARYGMLAIPHIHWGNPKDVERLAEWIRRSTSVEIVAASMQTYKTRALWHRALDGLKRFQLLVNRPLTYLLIGVSSLERVDELLPYLPRVCLVSARPDMLARNYRLMNEEGGVRRIPYANRGELFERNLATILKRINAERLVSA